MYFGEREKSELKNRTGGTQRQFSENICSELGLFEIYNLTEHLL